MGKLGNDPFRRGAAPRLAEQTPEAATEKKSAAVPDEKAKKNDAAGPVGNGKPAAAKSSAGKPTAAKTTPAKPSPAKQASTKQSSSRPSARPPPAQGERRRAAPESNPQNPPATLTAEEIAAPARASAVPDIQLR